MSLSDFEHLLTSKSISREEQQLFRDGYFILLKLGWPITCIDCKMCERAYAGLVPRYSGDSSWQAYKREWAWYDNKRSGFAGKQNLA